MERVEPLFKDNIKVFFAGSETQNQFEATKNMGIVYHLYTAYPFLERMIFEKPKAPIMAAYEWQKKNPYLIPQYIIESSKHCIQDSGLFTLMFGSQKGKKDEKFIDKWYEKLIEFTLKYGKNAICVEVDCQKVLGAEKAWEYRQRMKNDIPNRIINVFHLEDGQKGLDRMIEFSDYIAISVPELRIYKGKTYKQDVHRLACYIKNKKPEIDIHLLGCTELKMLKQNNFCTSSDSTTYVASKRFGFVNKNHVSKIDTEKVKRLVGENVFNTVRQFNNEQNTAVILLSIYKCLNGYKKYAGNQD